MYFWWFVGGSCFAQSGVGCDVLVGFVQSVDERITWCRLFCDMSRES